MSLLTLCLCWACNLEELPDINNFQVGFNCFTTSGNPETACPFPCEVQFDNISLPTSFQDFNWDFGDLDSTFTGREPGTITFPDTGRYTVTLTANFTSRPPESSTKVITVIDPVAQPQPAFTVQNNGCFAPCEVIFNNESNPATTDRLEWDFGDGSPIVIGSALDAQVRHTYAKAGDYEVTLRGFSFDGLKEETHVDDVEINIHSFPIVDGTLGTGVAVFQLADGSYRVFGNRGTSAGEQFMLRTQAGGGPNVIEVIPLPATAGNVKLADVTRLSDGTFALVGTATNGDNLSRIVYTRVNSDGTVATAPTLLEESSADFDNMTISAVRILDVGSSAVAVVGTATSNINTSAAVYVKRFQKNLPSQNPGELTFDVTDESFFAFDATVVESQLLIATTLYPNTGGTIPKLLLTSVTGVSEPGFPRELPATYQEAQGVLHGEDGMIYCAVKRNDNTIAVIQFSDVDDQVANWEEIVFSETNSSSFALIWDDVHHGALLMGAENGGGSFGLVRTDGTLVLKPSPLLPNSSTAFVNGTATIDCGFVMSGYTDDFGALFVSKLDEGGL